MPKPRRVSSPSPRGGSPRSVAKPSAPRRRGGSSPAASLGCTSEWADNLQGQTTNPQPSRSSCPLPSRPMFTSLHKKNGHHTRVCPLQQPNRAVVPVQPNSLPLRHHPLVDRAPRSLSALPSVVINQPRPRQRNMSRSRFLELLSAAAAASCADSSRASPSPWPSPTLSSGP